MPVIKSSRFLKRAAGLAGVLIAASAPSVAAAQTTPTPAQCAAVNNRTLYAFARVALTPRQQAAYGAINADVASRLVPILYQPPYEITALIQFLFPIEVMVSGKAMSAFHALQHASTISV